jgi:protein SCO1/2
MQTTTTTVDASRRDVLTGRVPGKNERAAHFDAAAAERASRQAQLQRLAPNVSLIDQDGRKVRFYDDVLKGRLVVLSAMYSACEKLCPPTMRNLIDAREMLGDAAGKLTFVTMTLTPLDDGPKQLLEYKQRYGLGKDWMFLTGRPDQMEIIQASLGYAPQRASDNLMTHASMVRICDERLMRWGHVNGMTSALNIARMIRYELA